MPAAIHTWRKVLYERQPFEDNYVDPTQFLRELRTNENVKSYTYVDVVQSTVVITRHISIVVLFTYAFLVVFTGQVGRYTLLSVDFALFIIAYLLNVIFIHRDDRRGEVETNESVSTSSTGTTVGGSTTTLPVARTSVLQSIVTNFNPSVFSLVALLVILTPILKSLTVTYSDDTIVALSLLTMFIHILMADYSYLNAYTTHFRPNLSVNAATFAVILMASRIDSALQSGALIAFGTICFSLSPPALHALRRASVVLHNAVTALLFCSATCCLVQIPVLRIIFVLSSMLISFFIPLCFVRLHSSFKHQIHGPWDEARPTNSAAAAEWANAGLLA